MIQINLSEKEARELLAFLYAVNPKAADVAKAVMTQVERQLMPSSTSQAEIAAWRGERIVPNLIEAWKRKHEVAQPIETWLVGTKASVILGEYADMKTGRLVTVMHNG